MSIIRKKLSYIFKRLITNDIKSNRQGFGSFHSEDIEILIRKSNDEYSSPSLYNSIKFNTDEIIKKSLINFEFGQHVKDSLFLLDNEWTFINHGAFGSTLAPIFHESIIWRYICEAQPLKFFDRDLIPMLAYVIRIMSSHIICPAHELIPLPNVTTGLNSIFNSIQLEKEDEVICFSLTYGSTKKMLNDLCVRSNANLHIIHLTLPILSNEEVINKLKLKLNNKTKLVVIDHITSNTAMELPIIELAKACKEVGAIVVIDAAHSLFSQNVSIYPRKNKENNELFISDVADYWLTNAHKWLCSPKGSAFMWVSPNRSNMTRPAIISHGFEPFNNDNKYNKMSIYPAKNKLLSSFTWDGCRDYTAMLTIPSTLRLWNEINNNNISNNYMKNTLKSATDMLIKEWNLNIEDFVAPYNMRENSPMSLVRIYFILFIIF